MVHVGVETKYRLLNLETGLYASRFPQDSFIVGSPYTHEATQVWLFQPGGHNTYFIKSTDSDDYIGVDGIEAEKQLSVSTTPFVWQVLDVPGMATAARFTPVGGKELYVGIWEASTEHGSKVVLRPLTGGDRIWLLEEVKEH